MTLAEQTIWTTEKLIDKYTEVIEQRDKLIEQNERLIQAASELLNHANDLRAGFQIRTSADATMITLGSTTITKTEYAIQFAKD